VPRTIEWLDSVDSTMRVAAERASAGAAAGTVIAAEEQTHGQGRLGRHWHSPRGTGLYFTQILRPALDRQHVAVVTLALGLGVADALALFAGVRCDLRWPNDVLCEGRKLCGILAQWHDGTVLAGVGLNVNQPDFPGDLRSIATSLRIVAGANFDKRILLKAIAGSIDAHVRMLETSGVEAILSLFKQASSYVEGRRVIVDLPDGALSGVTAGLTHEGMLKLRQADGRIRVLTAGGVRPDDGE
jgi:BirA family biotin operon repressor/biotin-[acetyl-CoA-carboxylase] ligase